MITYKELREKIAANTNIIVIHGAAGTGKSYFIRELVKNIDGRYLLLGSTGLTSKNIGGVTIDSLLYRYSIQPGKTLKMLSDNNYSCIIVDELSMVQMYKIDYLINMLQILNSQGKFIKLILVGDPFQLRPVVTENMKNEFSKQYGRVLSENDFYFFNSPAFINAVNLNQVDFYCFITQYRQKDGLFNSLLNSIAQGNIDNVGFMQLNKQYSMRTDCLPVVATKRMMVKHVNRVNLEKLSQSTQIPPYFYNSSCRNLLPGYEDKEKEIQDYMEPVNFAVGAPVKFIYNDVTLGITNGLTGNITNVDPVNWTVQVATSQTTSISCHPINLDVYRFVFNPFKGKVEIENVAEINRLPFVLNYATTVHSCQGATLDSMTFNSCRGCFAAGQLYTALTRIRSLQNLVLHVMIDNNDVKVSPVVLDYYYNIFRPRCTEVGESESNI